MRNRKPYDLKIAIRIYNLILVIINTYLFVHYLRLFKFGKDFWGCKDSLSRKNVYEAIYYGHLFFHTRYLEFFDTFFFVLRKKNSQINFLHVFHHGIVPTLMYIGIKFYPIPFNALLPTTNMFVHIIMYAYYGLATFGPKMQKYLWWKRYLTTMQLGQFALLLIHCAHPILYINDQECKFPIGLLIINICTGLTFLLLFISFYIETYCKANQSKAQINKYTTNGTEENVVKDGRIGNIGRTRAVEDYRSKDS